MSAKDEKNGHTNGFMTKKELAEAYHVHRSTFARELSNIKDLKLKKNSRILSPEQVQKVFLKLGNPFT